MLAKTFLKWILYGIQEHHLVMYPMHICAFFQHPYSSFSEQMGFSSVAVNNTKDIYNLHIIAKKSKKYYKVMLLFSNDCCSHRLRFFTWLFSKKTFCFFSTLISMVQYGTKNVSALRNGL